ncbi:hypothetical protein MLD38_031739 [Melastoma candidum]|uniref:Uncharacterized protein n=1 Tax=Melastoma candidum TaxID=119954 RepID=A0ACB9MQM5_9MYRT|nr:hypothetical protein MLD38_031739 [Melastoma candidum]
MSATIAAPATPCRHCPNPRRARKLPGSKHVATLGVGDSNNPSSARVSSSRSFLFGNVLPPRTVRGYPDEERRRTRSKGRPFFVPVMEWQDCTVKMEVDIPASAAYDFYSDRESFPSWMPFISSVKVLEDKPDLSRWSLKYTAFGQDIEYSWLSRNMQPIPNQKIHWRSLEGLPNRGAVRFYPKGPSSCVVELTVSYEVPQLLAPVASAVRPLLEGLMRQGLERFATIAKSQSS